MVKCHNSARTLHFFTTTGKNGLCLQHLQAKTIHVITRIYPYPLALPGTIVVLQRQMLPATNRYTFRQQCLFWTSSFGVQIVSFWPPLIFAHIWSWCELFFALVGFFGFSHLFLSDTCLSHIFSWPKRSLSPKFLIKWSKWMGDSGDSMESLHNPVKVNIELKLLVDKYPNFFLHNYLIHFLDLWKLTLRPTWKCGNVSRSTLGTEGGPQPSPWIVSNIFGRPGNQITTIHFGTERLPK